MTTATWVLRWCLIGCALTANLPASASQEDAEERFAWSADREAALNGFTPGSEADLYHRCLLAQQRGRLAEADALIAAWPQPPGRGLDIMRLRQAVLWLDRDAPRAWPLLVDALHLSFPTAQARAAEQLVGRAVFPTPEQCLHEWLRSSRTGEELTVEGRSRILAILPAEDPRLDSILDQLPVYPDAPGLVDALSRDLALVPSRFGGRVLERHLTTLQLAELSRRVPKVQATAAYAEVVLGQLAERYALTPWRSDDQALRAYLNAILASCVSPAFNATKMLVLHHFLALGLREGRVDAQILHSLHDLMSDPSAADTANSPDALLGLEPASADPTVVDEAIDQLLASGKTPDVASGLLDVEALQHRFLLAKVLSGNGAVTDWYRQLPASEIEPLDLRSSIAFARSQPHSYATDGPVSLDLLVKNVPSVTIRTYRLDAVAALRRDGHEISPDIDLTSLVPSDVMTLSYAQPAHVRHAESIPLPALAGPGAWIVEAAGQGTRACGLIRKGSLSALVNVDRHGHHLRVLDENGVAVDHGEAWIDGAHFVAEVDGTIRIPFVPSACSRNVVLAAAGRASLQRLRLVEEQYGLSARVLFSHEQLLADATATLIVAVHPQVAAQPFPASQLSSATLLIQWTLADGTMLAGRSHRLSLSDDADDVVTEHVPSGVVAAEWTIDASIRALSTDQLVDLHDSGRVAINGCLSAHQISGLLLHQQAGEWVLDVRGLAGEALPARLVELSGWSEDLLQPMLTQAISDAQGRIHLGTLPGMIRLQASMTGAGVDNGPREIWSLVTDEPLPRFISGSVDRVLTIPWHAQGRYALFAGDSDRYLDDCSALVTRQPGQLVIRGLHPGSYRLLLHVRDGIQVIGITIAPGRSQGSLVLDAHGACEPTPAAVCIGTPTVAAGQVRIPISGLSTRTRIQVLGLRWWPTRPVSWGGVMEGPRQSIHWERPLSVFLPEQTVAGEIRYIQDRRREPALPGSLLARPGVVLNPTPDIGPWQAIGPREAGGRRRSIARSGGSLASDRAAGGAATPDPSWTCLDFLATPGVVCANLIPDPAGAVVLRRDQLGDASLIAIIAEDGERSDQTVFPLPFTEPVIRERRLQTALSADPVQAACCEWIALPGGASQTIPDAPGTQYRLIATVSDLFDLLHAAYPACNIDAFAPLAHWNDLDAPARSRLYGTIASHEAHLFLHRHDPAWFASILIPYLSNKIQPTLVDRYLLKQDLTAERYLVDDATLNPFERALVALRSPDPLATNERERLDEETSDVDPEPAARDHLFAAAFAQASTAAAPSASAPPVIERGDATEVPVHGRQPRARAHPEECDPGIGDPQVMVESAYFQVDRHAEGAITPGPLWSAFARQDPAHPFLPTAGLEHLRTRTDLLLALALIDLPLVAGPAHRIAVDGGQSLTVATPALLALRHMQPVRPRPEVLAIHTWVIRSADRQRHERTPEVVTEASPNTPYVQMTSINNLTPVTQDADVLYQIPVGAVAVGGGEATTVQHIALDPFASTVCEADFYFPEVGVRSQAAIRISAGADLLAASDVRTWTVSPGHGSWWEDPDPAVIIAHLRHDPLGTLDLSFLAPRLDDPGFYQGVIAVLEKRSHYDRTVWSYSVLHQDVPHAVQYLQDVLRGAVGPYLSTTLVTIDDVATGVVPATDIEPLLNPRAHALDGHRVLGSVAALAIYRRWVDYWSHRPLLSARDRLVLTGQLFIQDRVREAAAVFASIDATQLTSRLQYDYCHAYLAIRTGDLVAARGEVESHRGYPIDRWRERFAALKRELDAIAGTAPSESVALNSRELQADLAGHQPSIHLERSGTAELLISATNAASCELQWHPVDLESLFSSAPFTLAHDPGFFTVVAPATRIAVTIRPGASPQRFTVPESVRTRSAVIDAVVDGAHHAVFWLADGLDIAVSASHGHLTVRGSDGTPIAAAYVKVYQDTGGGSASFSKDGYTDRLGRFDYRSVSSDIPSQARMAIFVDAQTQGQAVRIITQDGLGAIDPPPTPLVHDASPHGPGGN